MNPGRHWSPRRARAAGPTFIACVLASTFLHAQSVQQLTFAPGIDGDPSWSPEGDRIVFTSERTGSNGMDLWVIPAAGGTAERWTTHPSNEFAAAWSPDERTIAYYWAQEGKILLLPTHGGETGTFTPGNRTENAPAWAPDVTRLAFASTGPVDSASANTDIWIRTLHSGDERRLTSHPASDAHPTWSPDGSTIAFVSDRGGSWQLWSVPVAGGAPQRLSDVEAHEPAWSPDGAWIAFVSNGDLHAIPPQGGPAVPLTDSSALDFAPSWSPGSDHIVFMRRMGGESDLWILDFEPVGVGQTTWSNAKALYRTRKR